MGGSILSTPERPSESPWSDGENEDEQLRGLFFLLREVADSDVELDDPGMTHVLVQVPAETWERVRHFRSPE